MSREDHLPLIVVGAGVAGLATALGLARLGRTVHVLEGAIELGEIGAGIQLGPNATAVLDQFGLLEEIERVAVTPERLRLMSAVEGGEITSVDLRAGFRERFGYPYLVLHRQDLHGTLLAACRQTGLVTIETDRMVERVVQLDGFVRLHCLNGAEYEAGAVIGADGLWSSVRLLLSDDAPVCWPHVAYRGTIPIAEIPGGAPGGDDVLMWVGPDLHFVEYRVSGGERYNQVAVFKSRRYVSDSENWGGPDELDEVFGDMCEHLQVACQGLERSRRWPMIDRAPLAKWTRGDVALVGDAAHPMLQYLAQGGCQALEDAACLVDRIERHGDDLRGGFASYERIRLPRTERVQRTARLWGEICHLGGTGALMRDTLLSRRRPNDYAELDWLYGHRIPAAA